MRVVICPDFRATNPYQELLATAVSRQSITVLWGGYGRFALLKTLRQKPDLIHLHWTAPFWLDAHLQRSRLAALRFLAEILWIKQQGLKIVWTIHNLQDHERTNPPLEHRVNQQLCHLANQVIVPCRATAKSIRKTYRLPETFRPKMNIIGHGNFIGIYDNTMTQAAARQRLNLPLDALVFLFFGQIRSYKRVVELIQAFCQLEQKRAHLLIAGQPANPTITEALRHAHGNHPRIHLYLAFIPDIDIQQFMNAANMVVLPFADIAASSSIILALSFGKAIMTPSLGCLPEILDTHGCLFYNPAQETLLSVLQKSVTADWQSMGQHNLALARQMDWDDIGQQTVEVYRQA